MHKDTKNLLLIGGGLTVGYLALKPLIDAAKTAAGIGGTIADIISAPFRAVDFIVSGFQKGWWYVDHEAISQTPPDEAIEILEEAYEDIPLEDQPKATDEYVRLGIIIHPGGGKAGSVEAHLLIPTWLDWSAEDNYAIIGDFPVKSGVWLWAKPSDEYRFSHWEYAEGSSRAGKIIYQNPYSIVMHESYTLIARFTRV